MVDDYNWNALLSAGPLDGASLAIDVGLGDLPRAAVVTFATGDEPTHLVWHSYVLDRSRTRFRYLGEDRLLSLDLSEPEHGFGPWEGAPTSADDALARRFYEILFDRNPALRAMFPDDMRHQAVMLRIAVTGVLEHLEEPDWLVHVLGSLGARHAAWGVTESMYSEFALCMLSAMAEIAGEDWTPELARGWSSTLQDITELMLADTPPTR